jgi:integration host factor subunit beta
MGKIAVMNRSDLIIAISRSYPQLSPEDAAVATKTILDAMTESLCRGSRIEIRGFGSLSLHHLPPRIGRNPSTGDRVEIPATAIPRFKVTKELNLRINRHGHNPILVERESA